MTLLLLSNSTAPGRGYLEHALEEIHSVAGEAREILFVPFALADHASYTAQVAAALAPSGFSVTGLHEADDAPGAIAAAELIFVGGGNTFRLVDALHRHGLIDPIRSAVAAGIPYLGSSAGTNVACPSLRTTNDMPIVQPPTFDTLGLVPFQINPHYLDPDPSSRHQGETRELRILQYLEENPGPVLGLREGTWLRRDGNRLHLGGTPAGGRLFSRGSSPQEIPVGTDLSTMLSSS
ncbi:dipeptidase PepE [Ruania alba]|uniref:dipeptidase E n=1 Tax=Ruania alba TaxID=648782 RepID=A0A1H5NHX4_9MICO|nr:dipeptidase PepE [Ruania alba]SEF00318.1 alpha-aspartyl dipeptidase. Serine peptidase. MEROPS family S51 [Ruania alba]